MTATSPEHGHEDGAPPGFLTLAPPEDARYLESLHKAVQAARLSDAYYPPSRLCATLDLLHPRFHEGAYGHLKIASQSGLPTLRELLRPSTDRLAAAGELAPAGRVGDHAAATATPRSTAAELVARAPSSMRAYYDKLLRLEPPPLEDLAIHLRRQTSDRVALTATMDKLDSRGLLCRYTFLLSLPSAAKTAAPVLSREVADEVRVRLDRTTSLDGEMAYMQLATESELTIESVRRATLGPFFVPGVEAPAPIAAALAAAPKAFVLTCALELVGVDVPETGDNDPLSRGGVTGAALAADGAQRIQEHLRYRVYRDRKFIVTRDTAAAVAALCAAAGTRNVIYRADYT